MWRKKPSPLNCSPENSDCGIKLLNHRIPFHQNARAGMCTKHTDEHGKDIEGNTEVLWF